MHNNTSLGQKFFNIYRYLNKENRMNDKVAIISEVDMSKSVKLREILKKRGDFAPCITAIITKAITTALEKHPHVNTISTGFFSKKKHNLDTVDFTYAVERNLKTGEMVTYASTIRNSDTKGLMEIDSELRSLSTQAPELDNRWNLFYKLVKNAPTFLSKILLSTPNWSLNFWKKHRGGALFISSPCKYGGDSLVAAWPWPICFSFGKMKDRPVVVNGEIQIRPTINLTISFDRCYIPGAPAARFFQDVVTSIEETTFFNLSEIHEKKVTQSSAKIA